MYNDYDLQCACMYILLAEAKRDRLESKHFELNLDKLWHFNLNLKQPITFLSPYSIDSLWQPYVHVMGLVEIQGLFHVLIKK